MDISDQANQSIEVKNYEHPTGTISTTFNESVGEANHYVWFGYVPQEVC